jgi:hypothetical protein
MSFEETNKREREKRERRLVELRLRDVYRGPRCLVCQIPISSFVDALCESCDGD